MFELKELCSSSPSPSSKATKTGSTTPMAPTTTKTTDPLQICLSEGTGDASTSFDEWVFTLYLPERLREEADQQQKQQGRGQQQEQRRPPVVRLRQMQPVPPTPQSPQSPTDPGEEEEEEGVEVEYDLLHGRKNSSGERISLLRSSENTTAATTAAETSSESNNSNLSSSSSCWTFQSPFWSLQSSILLTVTYCPCWQAMPEYTEHCQVAARIPGLRACCVKSPCGKLTKPTVNYISESFSTNDIVKIEIVDEPSRSNNKKKSRQQPKTFMEIPGIGPCQMIRIYLRPLTQMDHDLAVPPRWQSAWESYAGRMRTTAASPMSNITDYNDGPVLTLCLPIDQTDPPLLWKVWLPSFAEYPIAVQTLTVLDGALEYNAATVPTTLPSPTTTPTTADNIDHQSTSMTTDTAPSRPPAAEMTMNNIIHPTHIYINGYQSWSFTGSLPRGRMQPSSALPGIFSRAFNHGGSPPPSASTVLTTSDHVVDDDDDGDEEGKNGSDEQRHPRRFKKFYQSDFFTCITSDGRVLSRFFPREFPYQRLDETGGPAMMLGWLSQDEQFGVINADKELSRFQMHCSADGQMLMPNHALETDWSYAQLIHPHSYDEEPMASYLHAVASFNKARPLMNGSLLTGWCSWYVFYEKIDEKILRKNFSRLADMRNLVPTNVAVVDDGYMTAWGDWDSLKPKKFDNGMKAVSDNISSVDMRPGLWLAPFAADKHSQVVREHPDWVIRNNHGVPANSSHCGKFFYGLDATNPAVRQYVHESIRRAVEEWNFNVLKIDFLYAACLEGNGKYDLSISRAQAMDLALHTIREAAGSKVFLIGCGCPIATGIGYVDAMRISADTGPTWYPSLPLPWWDNGTLPALRSMVRNSIARAPYGHRFWHNDPDCLMLGSHTSLTDAEVISAATVVGMTCGMLLLSDNLPKVSASRLSIVSKIFPLTGVSAVVLDLHSTNDGLPSLMRLWCTDRYGLLDSLSESMAVDQLGQRDHNAEATFFARRASFNPETELPDPSERKRSCIHVAGGMGTWTAVSISNWSDMPRVVRVPPPALLPPPETGWGCNCDEDPLFDSNETGGPKYGYHVFGFWSSKYSWLADNKEDHNDDPDHTVCKRLEPHETEVFHVKCVDPDEPQYIGSDIHFSCGFEVRLFRVQKPNTVYIFLKKVHRREGFIFVFLPRVDIEKVVQVTVNGERGLWEVVGSTPRKVPNESPRIVGRVIRVAIVIHGDGRKNDGEVMITY